MNLKKSLAGHKAWSAFRILQMQNRDFSVGKSGIAACKAGFRNTANPAMPGFAGGMLEGGLAPLLQTLWLLYHKAGILQDILHICLYLPHFRYFSRNAAAAPIAAAPANFKMPAAGFKKRYLLLSRLSSPLSLLSRRTYRPASRSFSFWDKCSLSGFTNKSARSKHSFSVLTTSMICLLTPFIWQSPLSFDFDLPAFP